MLHPFFLDEGTPILVGGFMLLGGAIALFGLAAYSTIFSTGSRGIRAIRLLVLWVMTGAASLLTLLPDNPLPWLVVIPLLFFGTSCYASYKLMTANRSAAE
jgi:hypothetical protein